MACIMRHLYQFNLNHFEFGTNEVRLGAEEIASCPIVFSSGTHARVVIYQANLYKHQEVGRLHHRLR